MKKTSLLTALFLMFAFMGFAQEWHGITSDSPAKMKQTLVSSTENEIVIDVQIDGFYTKTVKTPNGPQVIVSIDKMASMLEAGSPDLPIGHISAVIGDKAEMAVNVVKSNYVDFENVEVAPSKGNFSRQINPEDVPYTYGEVYSQNAFWPATQAYLEAPYILRDLRGQNIMVNPIAYNPVTKTLRVYTNMTIVMTKVSDNGENQKVSNRGANVKLSSEFKAAYDRRFINFTEGTKTYPWVEDNGEMLVICADQFMAAMQPFVDWKNQSGRPTTMVSVTTAGGNNADAIKSYITNMYNNPNNNLVYVLFVGDYNHITPHPFSYEGTQYSDIWFGMVEGTDYYEEVFVGRFSAQTDAHVTSQVNKVLYYERDMQANATWVDKGLGIGAIGAGSGHYGEDDYQHIDLIRDTLLHYTYNTITDSHQGGGATAAGFTSIINGGISIINYCNHGSETSWGVCNYSTSHVNALTNDNMWPIVWSVACLNGKFDYGGANGECFGEAWLRATNNSTGVPTGAVGGMFSWISQPWQPPMYGQDEMVDILTEWRHTDQFNHTLAGTSLNGAMGILDFGTSSQFTATQHSWILFGDPSLMVRTANPTDMNVSVSPSVLMLGMTEVEITADAEYGIATLSMDGEILASGNIINGQCALSFPGLSNVGNAELVIVGYNKVTYQNSIEVVPAEGAYVTVNGYEMNAPQANYGETVDMAISFKNVGVETASNIVATLTTESEYVNITSGEVTIASINPDQVLTVEGFSFEVAENVPDGTRVQFDVEITDGTNIWMGKIIIEMHAPILVMNSLTVNDNDVEFSFMNTGTAPFYGGQLNITSCSPDLVFNPETLVAEDVVEGGQSLDLAVNYTVDPSVEPGTTFEVAYDFTTGLFEVEDIFVLSYGAIMEDFESGSFGSEWTLSPNNNAWTIVDGGVKGTKCAKSMNEGMANTDYNATLTVNVLAAGELTFWYKVSSENNYDKLHFYMDNQEKGQWSGTVDWTEFTQPVTAGQHTFKWSYTKDSSVNSGSDCAWIDDIKFPPTNVITFIAPATNLEATLLDNHAVTLTWDASADAVEYVVKRDGETIGTTAETTFTDTVELQGVYKYSVYAINAAGSMSAPVSVFVTFDFTGAEEHEVAFGIYPNPAESVLNINANAAFEYQLINSVGQVVMSGMAERNAELNVNELNSGVYFLRVIANGNAQIEKVIIK